MIDLNRIGGGLKLLDYILKQNHKNKPWSKDTLVKNLQKQPNTYTQETRKKE